ncbi:MAG: hypothetical protein ACO1QR_09705 [Chthoniobacteraceae bacterium]
MSTLITRVAWCDEYEIHYCAHTETPAPSEGPITVYFPLTGEAYCSRFIPRPGLTDRTSPDFNPNARRVSDRSLDIDRFSIDEEGIRTSNPHILTAIVSRLIKTGGLKRVFQPCAPPLVRWENAQLLPIPMPVSLAQYCDALRSLFTNGFVDCAVYEVARGPLEDAIVESKSLLSPGVQFLEILRHPDIQSSFQIERADEALISERTKWTHYTPFYLVGHLAQTLVSGGAYENMWGKVDVALDLSSAVLKDLNRNYRNFDLFVCDAAWCPRFDGIIDHTLIVFDHELRRLVVLMASDTD